MQKRRDKQRVDVAVCGLVLQKVLWSNAVNGCSQVVTSPLLTLHCVSCVCLMWQACVPEPPSPPSSHIPPVKMMSAAVRTAMRAATPFTARVAGTSQAPTWIAVRCAHSGKCLLAYLPALVPLLLLHRVVVQQL